MLTRARSTCFVTPSIVVGPAASPGWLSRRSRLRRFFGDSYQGKKTTQKDQESDCNRDLKRFQRAPLDLYLDNSADDDIADHLKNYSNAQSEMAAAICEHWSEVLRLKDVQA